MSIQPYQHSEDVWLLNLGYVSEICEQNLMLYGYLSAPGVVNAELQVDVIKFQIRYAIVLDARAYRRYKLQCWLERKGGLFNKLALLFFLRRLGSFDPASRIARCIRDYAGPTWTTSTEVLSVKQYIRGVNEGGAKGWFFKDGISEGSGSPGQERSDNPAPVSS